MPGPGRPDRFGLVVVVAAALAARLAYTLVFPTVRSHDSLAWEMVAVMLRSGRNPYAQSDFLSWPPLWMQTVALLSWVSGAIGVRFDFVLRGFLWLVEAGVLGVLWQLIPRAFPGASRSWPLLLGIALNPACILLQTQHGNFDVLVAFWVGLAVLSLVRWHATRDPGAWMWACAFVGLGILTKTLPIMLVPLLAPGFRHLSWSQRGLGALLLAGPVTLAMSVIYVLFPDVTVARVLHYSPLPGYFGVSGLLELAGWSALEGAYIRAFKPLLFPALVLLSAWWSRREPLDGASLVRGAAVLMAFVPVFGPGFGPQYLWWFLPPFLVVAAGATGLERWLIVGALAVAAPTFMAEYAFIPSHGAALLHPGSPPGFQHMSEAISTTAGATKLRIPEFLLFAAMTVASAVALRRTRSARASLADAARSG